jgi:HSP20 family molecular chaperone IbpA
MVGALPEAPTFGPPVTNGVAFLIQGFAMTTRTLLLDSPFLLGFEHTQRLIDRAARGAGDAYPPYNVEARDDGSLRITLAVAGFTAEQLDVQVEDRQLTITGRREGESQGGGEASRAFLHRGIAARSFQRAFVLADGMRVSSATLEHGLLHVDVARPDPAARPISIPIRTTG